MYNFCFNSCSIFIVFISHLLNIRKEMANFCFIFPSFLLNIGMDMPLQGFRRRSLGLTLALHNPNLNSDGAIGNHSKENSRCTIEVHSIRSTMANPYITCDKTCKRSSFCQVFFR